MTQFVQGLFGGGNKAAKAEAARSRDLQKVANDRQLASLNRDSNAVGATRRAPRGRRLFEEGPSSADAVLA